MSNMRISGSGSIPTGEYEEISISGSGHCDGPIRCQSFSVSGSGRMEGSLSCNDLLRTSGSFRASGSVEAGSVRISGSCHIDGDCTVRENFSVSGSCRLGQKLSVQGEMRVSGSCRVGGDVEAESALLAGRVQCGGLLNAENVEIKASGSDSCTVGSIGCSRIEVRRETFSEFRFFIFKWQVGKNAGKSSFVLNVADSIEGDELYLEYTKAKRVSGRKIVLGEGREIETIQYSESLEGTTVNDCKTEKIS